MVSSTAGGGQALAPPKQRRVLIIRNSYSYDFGGAERFAAQLARQLGIDQLTGSSYTALLISRQPKLLAYATSIGVRNVRGWWWPRQNWSGRRALLVPAYLAWQGLLFGWYMLLLLRLRPDVVHPQSKDDFIAATLAAKLLGKQVVWTDHADLKYVFANHHIWYKNPVGKLVYAASRLASHITLVSRSEKQLIEAALGQPLPPKYVVVHNGVLGTPAPATLLRPAETADVLLFCATSRLVGAKGISELIAAFRRLHAERPATLLWLVGDGPDEAVFRQLADTEPAIRFVGHSDEPLSYVAACDIFVHPSYHEGLSLSLLEAAMLGRPIIACAVGGNPEIINDDVSGLLVPPRDAAALYAAMLKLADDAELRQRLGAAARSQYEANFNFTRIVREQIVPLYE